MLLRFLVVSKYELHKYKRSSIDQVIVLLVILGGFLMLITPQVQEASLPSSHKIYRIGFLQGDMLGTIDSYSLEFVPFTDKYEMMQASSLDRIDGFALDMGRGKVVYGSGTRKADAALSQLSSLLAAFNSRLVFQYIERDKNLTGVLLPVRLQVEEQEIDYAAAINGSIDAKRRQLLTPLPREPGQGRRVSQQLELLRKDQQDKDAEPSNVADRFVMDSPGGNSSELSLPASLSVEFPFKTLYKNMTLLSPIIMLSILLSMSLARERIDRNLENLFNSPLTNSEILFGKSLPYLAVMFILSLAYGGYSASGIQALKVTFVFFVISATLVSFSLFSVLISRSYRELTFIGSFSMFAFFFFIILPNVFAGINVLAFISPLDTVTSIENGAVIPAMDVFLSLLPYGFLSMFFLAFTVVCFNAEVMFSSLGFDGLLRVFYDTMSRILRNQVAYVVICVALLVPFIFIVESILAYLVMPLGSIAPLVSIVLLASVEEVVKIIPFYYRRISPLVYSIAAGLSFFAMEKLFNAYLIVKVYSYLGGPYLLFLQRFLPTLGLHILSTLAFSGILYFGKRRVWFPLGLLISVMMHVIYNYMVISGAA